MRLDTYLRVVLTIIALCLLWQCVRDFSTPAFAQREAQRVLIVGVEGQNFLPVSIAKIDVPDASGLLTGTKSLPITITKVALDGPLTVEGQEKTIPISIKNIDLKHQTMPITIKGVDIGYGLNDRNSLPIRGQVTLQRASP
jgi:hypothetical protein